MTTIPMNDLALVCNRCLEEKSPREQVGILLTHAGYERSRGSVGGPQYRRPGDQATTYLFPDGIDERLKGTFLLSVPGQQYSQEVLDFNTAMRDVRTRFGEYGQAMAFLGGAIAGLLVDAGIVFVTAYYNVFDKMVEKTPDLLIPVCFFGPLIAAAIALPIAVGKGYDMAEGKGRKRIESYLLAARHSERAYDPEIISEALQL